MSTLTKKKNLIHVPLNKEEEAVGKLDLRIFLAERPRTLELCNLKLLY